MIADGRDLITTAAGNAIVLDAARLDATAHYSNGTIASLGASPPHPGLSELVGTSAFAGFRGAIEKALPGQSRSHSVCFQLLDELPAAAAFCARPGSRCIWRDGSFRWTSVPAGRLAVPFFQA
jgi:hypothetical protein